MPEIVDADAHVIEGATFAREALERFPEQVELRSGENGGLYIEGRPYPDTRGPGAGCPPQHAMVDHDPNPHTVEGMLADADRDRIDRMVLFPSMALAVPTPTASCPNDEAKVPNRPVRCRATAFSSKLRVSLMAR